MYIIVNDLIAANYRLDTVNNFCLGAFVRHRSYALCGSYDRGGRRGIIVTIRGIYVHIYFGSNNSVE